MGGPQDGTPRRTRNCTRSSSTRAIPPISISGCRAAACMNPSTAEKAGRPRPGARGGRRVRRRQHLLPRPPLRAAQPERSRPPISRITAASTGSIGRRRNGCGSAGPCPSGSAMSAFRWWCTRATRTPFGSSRWTARRCGRAPAPAASRRLRHAQWRQALAARRRRPAGGPGVVDGEAPGD